MSTMKYSLEQNSNILAIIPARAGSKRLPGKNTKNICGKPLIAWTIDFARQLPEIADVLVSTDSKEIADIAKSCGASVPWLRPDSLATDMSNTSDVILHALETERQNGREYKYFVLLQPTSPIRSFGFIRNGIKCCLENNGELVVSFAPAKSNPFWMYKYNSNGINFMPFVDQKGFVSRSQDLPPLYEVTGNFYVMGVQNFIKNKALFTNEIYGVLSSNRILDCDIDDSYDWDVAEMLMNKYGSLHE